MAALPSVADRLLAHQPYLHATWPALHGALQAYAHAIRTQQCGTMPVPDLQGKNGPKPPEGLDYIPKTLASSALWNVMNIRERHRVAWAQKYLTNTTDTACALDEACVVAYLLIAHQKRVYDVASVPLLYKSRRLLLPRVLGVAVCLDLFTRIAHLRPLSWMCTPPVYAYWTELRRRLDAALPHVHDPTLVQFCNGVVAAFSPLETRAREEAPRQQQLQQELLKAQVQQRKQQAATAALAAEYAEQTPEARAAAAAERQREAQARLVRMQAQLTPDMIAAAEAKAQELFDADVASMVAARAAHKQARTAVQATTKAATEATMEATDRDNTTWASDNVLFAPETLQLWMEGGTEHDEGLAAYVVVPPAGAVLLTPSLHHAEDTDATGARASYESHTSGPVQWESHSVAAGMNVLSVAGSVKRKRTVILPQRPARNATVYSYEARLPVCDACSKLFYADVVHRRQGMATNDTRWQVYGTLGMRPELVGVSKPYNNDKRSKKVPPYYGLCAICVQLPHVMAYYAAHAAQDTAEVTVSDVVGAGRQNRGTSRLRFPIVIGG